MTTDQLIERVEELEAQVIALQTAMNNMVPKRMLNAYALIKQNEILSLQTQVEELQATLLELQTNG